ncbi:hypothetical protein LOD99_464 [Oopsacas minuta]|uniref:Transmembrane protein n=1 Tax=Oopsacas minuta TaxID=111878 RepID=A0AAV7K975_9METZ|nr:hypothetical protein LOD99_464 [Oopsacas minuta]
MYGNIAPILSGLVTLVAMLALIAAAASEHWFLVHVCDPYDFTLSSITPGSSNPSCTPDETEIETPTYPHTNSLCGMTERHAGFIRIGLFSGYSNFDPAVLGFRKESFLLWNYFQPYSTQSANRDFIRRNMFFGGIFSLLVISILLCLPAIFFSVLNSYQVVTTWWRGPASIYILNLVVSFFGLLAFGLAIDLYYEDLRYANIVDYNINIYTKTFPYASFYCNIVGALLPFVSVGLARFEAWRERQKKTTEKIPIALAPPPMMPVPMPLLPPESDLMLEPPEMPPEFDTQELTIPMKQSEASLFGSEVDDEMHF